MGYEAKEAPLEASNGAAGTVGTPENENAAQALIHAIMAGGM